MHWLMGEIQAVNHVTDFWKKGRFTNILYTQISFFWTYEYTIFDKHIPLTGFNVIDSPSKVRKFLQGKQPL